MARHNGRDGSTRESHTLPTRRGRGQEVPSEDPLVCAEYAAHYIAALQGLEPRHARAGEPTARGLPFLKTVATVKHFFDYDLEGVKPQKRTEIDVRVSARDQVEYFSPPFESAVKRGRAQSMMCSCECLPAHAAAAPRAVFVS